jgi:thiol-disulfide isomerase/thioredoxin
MWNRKIVPLLLIVIACGVGFYLYRKYRVAPDIQVVHLPLSDLQGNAVNTNSFAGKTLFVHYWATWCGECLQEMPSIESAYEKSDTNSVVFLMISDESPDKITRYLAQHNYRMKFLHLDKRFQDIGINTLPTTYIYDASGEEVLSEVGGAAWDEPAMVNIINRVVEK